CVTHVPEGPPSGSAPGRVPDCRGRRARYNGGMGTFDRFLEPPRLRTTSDDEDRRATWLELFFDLVFVAAIAELSYVLLAEVTVGGFARYLGYFVPIWWAWMGFTFYANRFDTDDLPYRLLTLAGMLGIAALAVNVRHVLEGASAENAFV